MDSFDTLSTRTNVPPWGRIAWTIPATMLIVLVGLTAVVWKMERIDQGANAESEASIYGNQVARQLETTLMNAPRLLRRQWRAGKLIKQDDFLAIIKPMLWRLPGIRFVGWVDDTGVCRQMVGQGGEALRGLKLTDQSDWVDLFARAKVSPNGAAGPVYVVPGVGPVLLGALAGVDGRSDTAGSGNIIFQFKLQPFMGALSDPRNADKFVLELSDAGRAFYHSPPSTSAGASAAVDASSVGERLAVMDRTWILRLTPTEAFVAQHVSDASRWAQWTWMLGAVALVLAILLAVRRQRASDQKQDNYLKALEKIAETSATVLGKMGSSDEIWHQLAEAARSLMSMSMAAIVVLEDAGTSLRFIANVGAEPSLVGAKIRMHDMLSAMRCVETRRAVYCSDIFKETAGLNRPLAEKYKVRSFVHVPLLVGDKTIGIMMLASEHVRPFSAADLRLAELWGGLAAVTISNEKLYEQTSEALASRNRLLQQRDALFAVHDAILQQESTDDILQRIADLAPAPVGVDACQIVLQSDPPGDLIVAATTTHYGANLKGYRFKAEGTNSGRVVGQTTAMIIEDARNDPSLHPYLRTQCPCDSLIYQPLLGTGGRPMGLLVLMRKDPGTFSREQLNMAQIFAVRAAAAIEIAELYEQTRRDAATKATLLSELKHRVKNNLTGIVGLLSIGVPPVAPRARQWLDRVVERVRTLAETHDLLIGGQNRVAVKELADQALRSLAVVTRPGIKVQVETEQCNVYLRNQRAVSVAMVLHELCYNALVHGLAESGMLRVVSNLQPSTDGRTKTLVMQVIDDGRGFVDTARETKSRAAAEWELFHSDSGRTAVAAALIASQPPRISALSEQGTGLGLNLVKDFVERELRGQFSVQSQLGHGTTATVEFALLEDELPSVV